MTSFTDVIILSSSPNTSPRIPTRVSKNTERTSEGFLASVTPSISSPSDLFLPPSRSRFFDVPTRKDDASKKKHPTTKNTSSSNSKEKDAPSEPRQKAKTITKESTHTVFEDLEPQSLDSRKTVTKKPAVSQKSRAKPKAKEDLGNLKLAGKVTKASKSNDTQLKTTTKKTGNKTEAAQSPPVGSTATPKPKASSNALGKGEVLHLDEAMRRRRDWTPPSETSSQLVNTMGNGTCLNENRQSRAKNGFGAILTDYSYSGSGSDSREVSANEEGPTKRRKIELMDLQCQPIHSRHSKEDTITPGDTSSSSGAQPKRKPKAQKRFTTLTARMTAQYISNDVEEDPSAEDITQYITQSKSRGGKKKKSTDPDPELIVLSPETAFKALDQQDVVFGTCSQLERDDSPETLRKTQQAIRASESRALGQTARSEVASSSMSRFTGARNLWSVAGRDTEGSLVQAMTVDNVDLTVTPNISKKKKDALDAPKRSSTPDVLDDEWLDLDDGKPGSSWNKASSPTNVLEPADPNPPTSAVHAQTVRHTQPAVIQSHRTTEAPQQAPMPRYSGFTDAELSRQVAAYGFKPVRGRKKMIDLLQKCWESKHGKADEPVDVSSQPTSASQVGNAAAAHSTVGPSPEAKSKGKSKAKKTSTSAPVTRIDTAKKRSSKKNQQEFSKVGRTPPSSYIDIEEIQDSEEEVFLSPSQVQKRYTEIISHTTPSDPVPSLEILTKNRPQPPTKCNATASKSSHSTKSMSTAASAEIETTQTADSSLLDISIQITKAVRAQPKLLSSSNSRSRPTWHEKILMYDPIVLEDFTSWLNVEGLGLIGEDREVGTAAVREWCEGKGICCCWKKNASW